MPATATNFTDVTFALACMLLHCPVGEVHYLCSQRQREVTIIIVRLSHLIEVLRTVSMSGAFLVSYVYYDSFYSI